MVIHLQLVDKVPGCGPEEENGDGHPKFVLGLLRKGVAAADLHVPLARSGLHREVSRDGFSAVCQGVIAG
jgi:hypothetical protein